MVIPVGFAQVNFLYTGPGVPTGAQWTLGINLEGSAETPTDIANECLAHYETADFDAVTASGTDLTGILVKFGPDATGPSSQIGVSVGGAGAAGGGAAISWLCRKLTAVGGRAGRGRTYFPGVPESSVEEGGTLNTGQLALMQNSWDLFYTAMAGGTFSPVLLHGEGSPLSAPNLITEFVVDSRVATQRRRQRR
jgi:hypothetical protein